MKAVIIISILTFIIATGVVMFLTGTFKSLLSKDTAEIKTDGEEDQDKISVDENEFQIKTEPEKEEQKQGAKASKTKEQQLQENLEKYEAEIQTAEKRLAEIKKEIDALNDNKTSVSARKQLAKIYSSMQPDTAAKVISELDKDLAVKILSEMNDRTAGKIMDSIAQEDANYAADIIKLIMAEK